MTDLSTLQVLLVLGVCLAGGALLIWTIIRS